MEEFDISESKGAFSSRKCYREVTVEQFDTPADIKMNNQLSVNKSETALSKLERYKFKTVEKNRDGTEVVTTERLKHWVTHLLSSVFLPQGFPFSVSSDYLKYQVWDTLQKLFSGISRPISTISVMAALGVGNAYASVVAATALKNAGQITRSFGKIFFTWILGGLMDSNAKEYRLMADIVYNVTLFLDLATTMFPDKMIPFVFCLSSFILSFVEVAGPCTRLAVLHHQSRANNSGDITAKDNSQDKMLNFIAAAITVPIIFQLEDKLTLSIILFTGFALCHIFCNYLGVRSLKLESLNDARIHICLKAFIESGTVPRFEEVNQKEQVILGLGLTEKRISKYKIHLGYSFRNLLKIYTKLNVDHSAVTKAFDEYQDRSFIILPDLSKRRIFILLHQGIRSEEILEAYVRSVFFGHYLIIPNQSQECQSALDPIISSKWEKFQIALLSAGFNTTNVKFKSCSEYRLTWTKS